ncbi:zinc-binding dehydrogenase [Chitinophaga caeni]|uniref:Zinc-binding dehydrogenase n=1 Tax=Chitinophaga caeni TaxID=2029983 RepID=A0A291QZ73_9BACT|nr:NAD(P)H-quinone oxidoreductase [Chitinophaga caeni]ATL49182.1 zinc-binding dehydrogenase [Chitinophaga caeni]
MKAVVISQPGGPNVLKYQPYPTPVLAADEVLIDVKAAGVNRPDIFQRKGNYPPPPGVPEDIPGLEVAGIITKCGPRADQWKVGDHVCALVAGGGYAQYVNVRQGQCLPVPPGWNFMEAASLPETVFTVWSNVFQRGQLKMGEDFLVHGGSSGIGITAIQLAKAIGAKVYTTVGSEEKGQVCLKLGADSFINYKEQDFEQALQSTGFDVILDMVGGSYFQKNLNLLHNDGRLVYINAMAGSEVSLDIKLMMRKRLTITGSTLRARSYEFKKALAKDILDNVWPIIASGKFRPVIYKTFPLEEAAAAHQLMESSHHIGKIVLLNE